MGYSDDDISRPASSCETRVRTQSDRQTCGVAASARPGPPPWKPGDRLGDFELLQFLGQGSSGYVYRALDLVAERCCALKLLRVESPKDLVRLKLGFRRMMSLSHPGLLRVDRIHHLDDQVALSMQEVRGETFAARIERWKRMERDEACAELLELTRHYAAALALMHLNGFVHRDIKPANLMVDHEGHGVVIDYGLVGTFDPEVDPNGARTYLAGTPMYLAPEVLWHQSYTPAGDIFSLGIVVLEALQAITGEPHVARNETDRDEDLQMLGDSIGGLHESLPEVLREGCQEMLEYDPGDRPTAMRIARLGLPPSAPLLLSNERAMYGRQRELDQVRRWLTSIYAGRTARLHLTGPSGIGKTRLVREILQCIEAKRWGQVFHARCRQREDQPLQAFGQIVDVLVNRYMKMDREPLQVDPVSESILQMAFPSLNGVLETDMTVPTLTETAPRADALEAAVRLSRELRKVGPLILVVDDIQWADRDSLNVLDRLQNETEGMLGVITVSRDGLDPQHLPPHETVRLEPLSEEDSRAMLREAALQHSLEIDTEVLEELAEVAEGCPHRLVELAEEFRPGGALNLPVGTKSGDSSASQITHIDRLWYQRAKRLSEDARRVLPLIATAGRRVSTHQLGALTELGDAVDAAVSELAQQRLIHDEATGGECITVVHDRVAEGVIETLDAEAKRRAHEAWAELLIRHDSERTHSAEIARHLFDAGQPRRAVPYALQTAEDAEKRFARIEAAHWYKRVIPYVSGQQRIACLQQAARCFESSNRPGEAAELYQQLAGLSDPPDRFRHDLTAMALLIRCGRLSEVRQRLVSIGDRLGLPRLKSPRMTRLLAPLRARSVNQQYAAWQQFASNVRHGEFPPNPPRSTVEAQRLHFCMATARPLRVFDHRLGREITSAASELALHHGTLEERLDVAINLAAFGCCHRGRRREQSERMLEDLQPTVLALGGPRMVGDLWSAIAMSHFTAGRWCQVFEPVQASLQSYQESFSIEEHSHSNSFEIAFTRFPQLWAMFQTGQLGSMAQPAEELVGDASFQRNSFGRLIATGGLGAAAWLLRDDLETLQQLCAGPLAVDPRGELQLIELFHWLTEMQCLSYEGRWDAALESLRATEHRVKRWPGRRIQILRIVGHCFAVLPALQKIREEGPTGRTVRFARRHIRHLRREQMDFADMLAELYAGLLQRLLGHTTAAADHLRKARQQACDQQLLPYRLAAEDALAEIQTGRVATALRQHLADQGAVKPAPFARLYTVELDAPSQRG